MKFTDGYWEIKPHIKASFAIEYLTHEIEGNRLRVFATTIHLEHRGSLTNTALLTVEFSAPMPGVIRTDILHFAGSIKTSPVFELNEALNVKPEMDDREDQVIFRSGDLSAHISKRPKGWQVEYYRNGMFLTRSDDQNTAYMLDKDENKGYTVQQLLISPGEYIYGLGERFTPFVKNGQTVDMWNEDGGTSTEIAYKNIPFYLSNRGYGVLVENPGDVSFEIASEKVHRVQFSVGEENLAYYVISGSHLKEVLTRYGRLSGFPALPPSWSFGLWLSACFTPDYDEIIMSNFLSEMERREIPVSVFHLDPYWMKPYEWVSLRWNEEIFPNPAETLQNLKAGKRRACLWINPFIGQKSPLFKEGMEKGYLVKKIDGTVWQTDRWIAGMALVDFTNPAAANWFSEKLAALVDMGVDCFKTDFGERIPVRDIAWYDGSDPVRMHNYYASLYTGTVFRLLNRKKGAGEACIFARAATVGGQRFPVHWGGDNLASYASMAETLRGGLSLALAGFGFWSHDISGFESTATPDLYKRWAAFGLLSTHSRLHGNNSYRVPWLFDEESCLVLKFFTNLKMKLMPYLYAKAVEATETAVPVMRPMFLEFPEDRNCHALDMQYMLGESLLVAPIFNDTGNVCFYLPEGMWTNYITGAKYAGGKWYQEKHDYFSLPLMVRENTVLPVGSREDCPDYDYFDGLELQLFEIHQETEIILTVYDHKGKNPVDVRVSRQGSVISVRLSRSLPKWSVKIDGSLSDGSGNLLEVLTQ